MYSVIENSVVVSEPRCSQMFFLYTGIMRAVYGEDPVAFLRDTGLGDRNFAVFRDPWCCAYRRGISDAVNSLDAMVDFQRALLREMKHVRNVYHLGVCAGGVPALYCGAALGSDEVWSFAIRALRSGDHSACFGNRDGEGGDLLDFEFMNELRVHVETAPAYCRFGVYYATDNEVDRCFAETLTATGRITSHPQPTPPAVERNHNVVGILRTLGKLQSLFPAFSKA